MRIRPHLDPAAKRLLEKDRARRLVNRQLWKIKRANLKREKEKPKDGK